ncbi:sensor histidine kinase [Ruminiclostridium cellulolyticum]|uniref:histidine kinase n=1 Tax=Ruminiclostridium cellulolyticum (strain ATCC 35319 / DSM 5812 / JCM 6584 / H10) TaxID=394503 RepID=B8I5S9_RUMCH|nr:HAMP domain-containing sensor histidine kinase [Ruminiclostridium cellulolyticum]ACL74746.1 histidine kinase [Ruminiclostridium cellulolyticum H10]
MFGIFILLWIISILIIYANPKEYWAWCASLCLLFNGFGGLSAVLGDKLIPYLEACGNENLIFASRIFKGTADILQHYFATYVFLIFVLLFTNFLNIQMKSIIKKTIVGLLSVPSILMLFLYPITPDFNPNYGILSCWVCVYTLLANIILIISIVKEKDDYTKTQRILTSLYAVPSTICVLWTSYISVAIGYSRVWKANVWVIAGEFILFIVFCLKYGMLGIHFKIERINIDNNIDSIIGGMSIVSHAIKNEVSTINLCVETIMCVEKTSPGMAHKLSIIKNSCKNLLEFTRKVSEIKLYKMNFKPCLLSEITTEVINQVAPSICEKNIQIINESKIDITMLIDPVHVSEVLKNLIINAIEAIPSEGIISVNAEFLNNKKLCIRVSDNGIGIPKDFINKVMTPFFSTKKGKNNFGLGLSYCFKVMKSHNGNLQIKSKENQGTDMCLIFPINKVVHVYSKSLPKNKSYHL